LLKIFHSLIFFENRSISNVYVCTKMEAPSLAYVTNTCLWYSITDLMTVCLSLYRCEFASQNTGGCQANQYYTPVTNTSAISGSQLSTLGKLKSTLITYEMHFLFFVKLPPNHGKSLHKDENNLAVEVRRVQSNAHDAFCSFSIFSS
jgi:hypothetical protein